MAHLDGLIQITDMIAEISRRIGNQTDLEAPGDVIEREINNAYLYIVERIRHHEFMVDKPFFFDSEIIEHSDAVGTAGTSTFTTANADIVTAADPTGQRLVDGVAHLTSVEGITNVGRTITGIEIDFPVPGTTTVSIAPEITTTLVSADITLARRRYGLPKTDGNGNIIAFGEPGFATAKDAFFLYSVTDVTSDVPLRESDVRLFDRGVPVTSQQPIYYHRVKNEIGLYPIPMRLVATTTNRAVRIRVRFAYRPEYKTLTDTLAPLPEEWQSVVVDEAFARMLDIEGANERAASVREALVERLVSTLMRPSVEEVEDSETALLPVLRR